MPHTYPLPPAYGEQQFFPQPSYDLPPAFKSQSPLREPSTVFPEHASFPTSSPRISESSSTDTPLYSPALSLSNPFDAFLDSSSSATSAELCPTQPSTTPLQPSLPMHYTYSPTSHSANQPHAQLTADGHGLILPADPHDPSPVGSPFQPYQGQGGFYTSAFAAYDPFAQAALYQSHALNGNGNGIHSLPIPEGYTYNSALRLSHAVGSVSPSSSNNSPPLHPTDPTHMHMRHTSLPLPPSSAAAAAQIALTFPIPSGSPVPRKRRTLSHSHAHGSAAEHDPSYPATEEPGEHGGQRPKIHVCPTCTRCFSRSHDMRRHIRGHNEGSQHKCEACGRGFRRLDAVKRHLRTACQGGPGGMGNMGMSMSMSGGMGMSGMMGQAQMR